MWQLFDGEENMICVTELFSDFVTAPQDSGDTGGRYFPQFIPVTYSSFWGYTLTQTAV